MTTIQPYPFLTLWQYSDNYAGAQWTDYYGSGVGQHRDSDALERSNFECMKAALNDLDNSAPFTPPDATDSAGDEIQSRIVVHEGHWAVGWVEWIAIHDTDTAALTLCNNIMEGLSDYPVIDETHFSEIETEEANETWANCYRVSDRIKYIRQHRSQFEFRDYADLMGCVRGVYFSGYASELLH